MPANKGSVLDPYLGRLSGADGEIHVEPKRPKEIPTTAENIEQQKTTPQIQEKVKRPTAAPTTAPRTAPTTAVDIPSGSVLGMDIDRRKKKKERIFAGDNSDHEK